MYNCVLDTDKFPNDHRLLKWNKIVHHQSKRKIVCTLYIKPYLFYFNFKSSYYYQIYKEGYLVYKKKTSRAGQMTTGPGHSYVDP